MRTPKTQEVKVIQFNCGYGWDDECVYNKNEYDNIRHDLKEYRKSGIPGSYRVITRRVPTN